MLTLKGRKHFYANIPTIEKFLYAFPNKKLLRQFKAEEVDDYIIEFAKTHKPIRVAVHTARINAFWKWVREYLGYKIPNPMLHTHLRRRVSDRPKKTITWEILQAVVKEACDEAVEEYLEARILNSRPSQYRPRYATIFNDASKRLGYDYTLGDVSHSLTGLRLSVLKDLHCKLCKTCPSETKPLCDTH